MKFNISYKGRPEIAKYLVIGYLSFLTLFLTSCEGYRTADGVVIDKNTRLPLDSVFVNVTTGNASIYTDSTGMFSLSNQMGGCVFGCKDIMVEFSKDGYQKITLMNDECNGTIELEK